MKRKHWELTLIFILLVILFATFLAIPAIRLLVKSFWGETGLTTEFYTSVLTAISDLNIPLLLPVGVGVLLGIFFGAKGINWCMKHYEQQTYFAILGLIAGSVPPILLNAGFTPGVQTVVSLFTLAAGAAIAWWMGKLES